MKYGALLLIACFVVPLQGAWPQSNGDGSWPREIDAGRVHLVVYQPQVDSWKDNRIQARSAVIVTRAEDPTQIFGTVSVSARTEIDKETRLVSFENVTIKEANFPSAPSLQSSLLKAVRSSVSNWPRAVSLDRLEADLEISQADTKAESTRLKNDPPRIIFSNRPAVLILIDGEPVYQAVTGTRYTRAVNTPALLLFDSVAGTFYLDGGQWWMTARSLNGPWAAAVNPPQDLESIRQEAARDEEEDVGARPATIAEGPSPAVFVSAVPAELLVTRGEPLYSPIPNTNLLYVTNSDNDIFIEANDQRSYTLLAGRWFHAKSLEGPWEWTPPEQLPRDFTRISPESPKGHVLASIPGTEQAREAVIENEIPQTATVRRSEATLEVHYAGDPKFLPIEGTGMEYAANTSSEVVRAEGRYYAIQHGVWFVANAPVGPWAVADLIPAAIYTIPPSSPLYHVRYVRVYEATPDFVYVGYTPGYLGAFVSDGVVVFGTGWWYPGTICGDYWCGWPWTWGFGFEFSYWGGGWFWWPSHHYWWYHGTPFSHRIFSEHWTPRPGPPSAAWIRGNVNAYSHWTGNAVVARNFKTPRALPQPGAAHPDLYAGKNGNVYQHRSDGWYAQNKSGQWRKTTANLQLDRQRDSRSFGQSRQKEFENRGQSPGIPRTVAPPRMMLPSRPSMPIRGRGRD